MILDPKGGQRSYNVYFGNQNEEFDGKPLEMCARMLVCVLCCMYVYVLL